MKLYRVNDNLKLESIDVRHWAFGYECETETFDGIAKWLISFEDLGTYNISTVPKRAMLYKFSEINLEIETIVLRQQYLETQKLIIEEMINKV